MKQEQMDRDEQILGSLWAGLTAARDIDVRFFAATDEGMGTDNALSNTIANRRRQKDQGIKSDLAAIMAAIDETSQVYISSGMAGVQALFSCIHLTTNHPTIGKGLRIMRAHCSAKVDDKLRTSAKSIAKQAQPLHDQLRTIFIRVESEVWAEVNQKRQRDRRNKVMRRHIKEGLVNRMELPRRLQKEFGEAAFFLSPFGAGRVAQLANINRQKIRSYKFHEHIAQHEMIATRVLRAALAHHLRKGCRVLNFRSESEIRKLFREKKQKAKAIADFSFLISVNQIVQEFWIEIDCGSQPISKLANLTRIKLPLIVIATSKTLCLRRRNELIASNIMMPFFITTAERFTRSGILDAGYITRTRSEFCTCEQLVVDTDRNCICDKNGCICILAYFYNTKQNKLVKIGSGATTAKPTVALSQEQIEAENFSLPVKPKPKIKQTKQKKQKTVIFGFTISELIGLGVSLLVLYLIERKWGLLSFTRNWLGRLF